MKMILLIAVALLFAQQPAPTEPLLADVHASPYRASINFTVNVSRQRLDLRNATIVNMIDFAQGREDDDGREDNSIAGGPTWIDLDRFDVTAIIRGLRQANPNEQLRVVVSRVLAERFHLLYHSGNRPLPGFIATASKDGPKLAEAKDPAVANDCQRSQNKTEPGQTIVSCTSETIGQLLAWYQEVFPHSLIDRTGLKKPYDFSFTFPTAALKTRAGYIHALVDAFSRQLGIVIAPGDVAQPAIIVDSVERPAANAPEIAKLIPALPDLQFEVASIRPSAVTEPQSQIQPAGSQITFTNFTLQELLRQAWQLPTGAMLGNAPPWLDSVRYTILVKLPPEVDARAVLQDRDQLYNMLQKLLVDRFRIKYHWGEQTADGYVLLPGTPKMKKADPNSRSFCKYGPHEGEKDVRMADSAFDAEFHCQNVTMAQFADLAQPMAKSEIKSRVSDKTGLAGEYDFTLYYTTGHKMRLDAAAAAREASSSEPVVSLSVEEAFRKELGIRLEKQRGTYPALILEHIEEMPTEN